MPSPNVETRLATLKENYNSLAHAYRRGALKGMFQLTTKDGLIKRIYKKFSGADEPILFRDVAVKLFEQTQLLDDSYKERTNLSNDVKEQIAEYKIRAQTMSYEISDYFLTTSDVMSKHFMNLTREATKDVESYYAKHYGFVATQQVKLNIVKQTVLGALLGVNALYRSYDAAKYTTGLDYVEQLIDFLEVDFAKFCNRRHAAFGLLGLAYFLKGRLLLGLVRYGEAEDCFRLSAENYVKKLPNRAEAFEESVRQANRGDESLDATTLQAGTAEVSVAEVLTLRRAALALAFGSGYTALINSRVKEANSLLTLARGILHFNALPVYAAYTNLLYWAAKRAEHSSDIKVLLEAKKGIEECRVIFAADVPYSHYPHRCSIEHSLVLHYLAQNQPAEKSAYYQTAIDELKAAVKFASGAGETWATNKQLHSEACYILSHTLRYQSADMSASGDERSVATLREAFRYAKEAELSAKDFPRHKCEALLALCGVYADVAKREIELSEIDPHSKPNASAGSLSRNYACQVLKLNDGANQRISAICFLRLVDYYLKNPNTYARAYSYWEDWLKIKNAIEHAFVNEWAARTELELNKIKARTLIIDVARKSDISDLREDLNLTFAKHNIEAWVEKVHNQYEYDGEEIKMKTPGKRGPKASFQIALETFIAKTLKITDGEAKDLIKTHHLLEMANQLMESYLLGESSS